MQPEVKPFLPKSSSSLPLLSSIIPFSRVLVPWGPIQMGRFFRVLENASTEECSTPPVSLDTSSFLPLLLSLFLYCFLSCSLGSSLEGLCSASGFNFSWLAHFSRMTLRSAPHTPRLLTPAVLVRRRPPRVVSVNEGVGQHLPDVGRDFAEATIRRDAQTDLWGSTILRVNVDTRRCNNVAVATAFRGWRDVDRQVRVLVGYVNGVCGVRPRG